MRGACPSGYPEATTILQGPRKRGWTPCPAVRVLRLWLKQRRCDTIEPVTRWCGTVGTLRAVMERASAAGMALREGRTASLGLFVTYM